jgi:5,10-methylenetetrahydromethanopterin reductase
MKIGFGIMAPGQTPDVDEFRAIVRRADQAGVSHIGAAESMAHESFTIAGLIAAETESARVGLTMINPITRLPGTVAAALASLGYISKRRAYLILARGDGAVRNAGYTPAKVETVRAYFLAVREILEHAETVYKGRRIVLRSPLKEWGPGTPMGFVAEGPRMLHLAGELADVVQVGAGLTSEVVRDSIERIRDGAEEAGRKLSDVEIWWGGRFHLARTAQEAFDDPATLTSLASMGNHALRGDYEEKRVPVELWDRLGRYHREFDYAVKGVRHGKNVQLMQELGLTSYFNDRFGVIGGPEEVVERLRHLESLGVTNIGLGVRRLADMDLLEEVMRAVM